MKKLFIQLAAILTKNWISITLLLMVIISIGSLIPLPKLPELPGKDKSLHFMAYALLALPVSWAKPKNMYIILIFFVLYSGVIEVIQPYVNRYGEWLDLLANSMGVAIGHLLGQLIFRIEKRVNNIG